MLVLALLSEQHFEKVVDVQDMYDQPLTFSRGPADTMMLALLRAVYSGRGDSQMVVSMEQALPLQRSWLNFNRLRIRADRTIPLAPASNCSPLLKVAILRFFSCSTPLVHWWKFQISLKKAIKGCGHCSAMCIHFHGTRDLAH